MKKSVFCYIALATVLPPHASLADDAIDVRISTASAEFAPQAEAKRILVPTELEYAIEATLNCENGSEPGSLSLGVADTRHHFSLVDLDDPGHVTATFVVPGAQLAPLVTKGYCVADDPASQTTILVRDAFTAQLSLACRSADSTFLHYLSQPLSVRLVCAAAREDQEAAPETAAR